MLRLIFCIWPGRGLRDATWAEVTPSVSREAPRFSGESRHNYLLDENLVDVKTLRDQLETLRHFETLAADVRSRIADLDAIETLDQERTNHRRLRLINGYLRRHAQSDTYLAQLKRDRLELDAKQVALSRHLLQRDDLDEQLKAARQTLEDAVVALRTDTTAQQEARLREAAAQAEAELAALREAAAAFEASLAEERQDLARLCLLLAEDEQTPPAALAGNLEPVTAEALDRIQSDLTALGNDYARRHALVTEQAQQLRGEAARLQHEIDQLRTGDRDVSYATAAPQAAQLRRLLRAELGLGADEVVYLCTVLEVPDEAWQDAVEGVLGRARFDLLVPVAHYDAAMRIYQRHRVKAQLHGVGLPDSERLLQHARPVPAGRLAEEVETEHLAARALVDLLLGSYVKCDGLAALRDHRTAVTRDCFVRRNFTSRHLDPRYYRQWFIGERAGPRQIQQREQRLDAIAGELAVLQVEDTALGERLALTRDKVRGYIELEHALRALARLPELETELRDLRDQLAALDVRSVETLREAVTARRAEVRAQEEEAKALDQALGRLRSEIEMLNDERLPALERQAAAALQEAEAFLETEAGSDLLEDAQKEYESRRERQPLETVLVNATRYEGNYASAELRSRDRLREAKHVYSLAYQFGYDSDEDAARYVQERDRYVASELPDYETRIADQRALAEQELVENFIHRLREQIEDARQQLAYLNTTLARLRFGGERFEYITRAEPILRHVYDMVMDSQSVLGTALFESDFRRRHQEGWDLLFERLTTGSGETLAPELQALQDYRNYLRYDIRIHYPGGDTALLSHIKAKKSGGETTTPFYVAMAASFAQAYRLHQPRPSDTIRLALFDEAFGKMDTARTASALRFMVDSRLQVILATPPDKAAGLLPYVDCVRTVVRQDNHAFVVDIDKAALLEELEAPVERAVPAASPTAAAAPAPADAPAPA